MRAVLMRTGSVAAQPPVVSASKVAALSRQDSLAGVRSAAASPRAAAALHLEVNRRTGGIRRALSETDVMRSAGGLMGTRSMSFPSMVPEEVCVDSLDEVWRRSGIAVDDEEEFGGGGFGRGGGGKGGDHGSGGGFGGSRKNMGEYYQEMLKSNPGDPLLLRNYGKYLYEVEGDYTRAEECYGRAILASPGDGEVLSLYGKLIWETQRDGRRARSYFDQAVRASPEDCTVLGSYAHFMWEVEDEEEEVEGVGGTPATFIVAF